MRASTLLRLHVVSVQGSRGTGISAMGTSGATVVRRTCPKSAAKPPAVATASAWLDKGSGEYCKAGCRGMVDFLPTTNHREELVGAHPKQALALFIERPEERIAWNLDYFHAELPEVNDRHLRTLVHLVRTVTR